MKVLVTGGGQLSWELTRTAPEGVECIALGRNELDITDTTQLTECFERINPRAVINAAAYTAVDKAESESNLAFKVNSQGAKLLAEHCRPLGVYLLHISTDFVFDGSSSRPYVPESRKKPMSVYGQSKSDGEDLIALTMEKDWGIIRTAWVYSAHGNNFVKTMLRLMSEKPALNVVGDQVGSPTWAKGLAIACWVALSNRLQGIYHWTDAGVASWYDFAVAIQREGLSQGLLSKSIPIHSIPSESYPTPAARPSYSVLDKSKIHEALGLAPTHWQAQLSAMMADLAAAQAQPDRD